MKEYCTDPHRVTALVTDPAYSKASLDSAQVAITAVVAIQYYTKDVIDTWTIIDDATEQIVK